MPEVSDRLAISQERAGMPMVNWGFLVVGSKLSWLERLLDREGTRPETKGVAADRAQERPIAALL